MTDAKQKSAAKAFAEYWQDKGYEKGESQAFWLSLLREVFGVSEPEKLIRFEDQVKLDKSTGFIDGFIANTHVMIEQKGAGKELNKPIKQSDGSLLTPFQQAKRYSAELPYSDRPRWIVTCNFREFYVYDMEKPHGEPEKIRLCDLEKEYYRLAFLVEQGNTHVQREMEISIKAGEVVGLLYDGLLKQYKDPEDPETLKSLNKLCVRLVFCLYAEDAGIFGKHLMFHDYMAQFAVKDMRKGLRQLFKVLNQKTEDRDEYLADDNVHMAWMRAICGRMKSDYSYSKNIVYNNFPWPSPTDAQKALIEQTAQGILDARALYPDASLADLYDELTMPPELRKAHQQNDRAVMAAYGFPVKGFTESDCVAALMRMYQELTEKAE